MPPPAPAQVATVLVGRGGVKAHLSVEFPLSAPFGATAPLSAPVSGPSDRNTKQGFNRGFEFTALLHTLKSLLELFVVE